jgi:hypothetical protein
MTTVLHDASALKLHTATDGTVWFADGSRVPIASGIGVHEFVKSLSQRGGKLYVRMIGNHANARLITLLHRRCKVAGSLEVASPLIGGTASERATPEAVLYRMRQCKLPSSLGGWHPLGRLDYPAYAMIRQFQESNRFDDHVLALLKGHPAWHDLKYVHTISPDWVAWLLTFIIDPRWYIDLNHPDRVSKLQAYLGLTPKIMERVVNGDHAAGSASRCRAVLGSWYDLGPPDSSEADAPGNFLWRIFESAGGGPRGLLRASQKFIVYLRQTWLQALHGGRTELFMPEMLFKRLDEIEGYKSHCSTRASSV